MTKCNVKDVSLVLLQWFEEKLQEVEGEDQQLRKLHAMVDSLVNHRKGETPTMTPRMGGDPQLSALQL